ncbi:MAG: DNA-binding protein WhiA [Tissierellia bacterium]|nr:DNA-binding protein WhiA [Tissierellia bacterium]
MSFSKRCKKEISIKELKFEFLDAELFSYVKLSASLKIIGGEFNISFDADYNHQARRIYNIIKTKYDYSPTIQVNESNKFGKNKYYRVIVEDCEIVNDIIKNTGFLENNTSNEILKQLENDEYKKIFLKNAFLLYGSINDPRRGYYVEIGIYNEVISKVLLELMLYFDLNPKIMTRNKLYIVYLKDSDKISDFLSIISAYKSLLELEDVRAMKSLRNDINRKTNCDKANIDRIVNASLKQINAIKKLKELNLYESLKDDEKEICELRLSNPSMSLEELSKNLDSKMTKAKINYRLQKIIRLANNSN